MTPDPTPNPVAIDLALAHLESDPDTDWLLVTRNPVKGGARLASYCHTSSTNLQQMIAYALTQAQKHQD